MRFPACIGIFCLCFMDLGTLSARDRLVISAIENSPNACMAATILDKAYGELGIVTEFRFLSGKTALAASSRGEVDGELARIGAVAERFPSLIKVDAPIFMLQTAFFTVASDDVQVLKEDDLAALRIGQMEGIVRFDQVTKDLDNVLHGRSYVELFEMLQAEKVDVVIGDLVAGQLMLSKLNLDSIRVSGGAVHREPLYHYLHEKNVDLAPDIGATLGRMNDSGELIQIIEQSIAKILSGDLNCKLN